MSAGPLLILQADQQLGPFAPEAVRDMLRTGTLSPKDLAWQDGMPEWLPLEVIFPDVTAATESVGTNPDRVAGTGELALPAERSYPAFVADAFSYPFRGDGFIILLCGTLLFSVLGIVPAVGLLGTVTAIALWGYLLLMLQSVVQGTAQGEEVLPRWPGFTGFGELFETWVQWLAVLVVSFGPAYGVAIATSTDPSGQTELGRLVVLGLTVAGGIYFPMAALGVAMFDSVSALSPRLVLRGILTVPHHYLLLLVTLAALGLVQLLTGRLSDHVPYLGTFVDNFDRLWSAVFFARLLGGLYYVNRRKLGWF